MSIVLRVTFCALHAGVVCCIFATWCIVLSVTFCALHAGIVCCIFATWCFPQVVRGDLRQLHIALLASAVGARTAGVPVATQLWIELHSDDGLNLERATVEGSTLVLRRWDHIAESRASPYATGVSSGRLKCFVTSEWFAYLLADWRQPVTSVTMLRLSFAWHPRHLDSIHSLKIEAEDHFVPTISRLGCCAGADDEEPDWRNAFAHRSRRQAPAPSAAQSPLGNLPAPLEDLGEFGGDVVDLEAAIEEMLNASEEELTSGMAAVVAARGGEANDSHSDTGDDEDDAESVRSSEYVDLAELDFASDDGETSGLVGGASASSGSAAFGAGGGCSASSSAGSLLGQPAKGRAHRPRDARDSDLPWTKRAVRDDQGVIVGWIVYDEMNQQLDAHCGVNSHLLDPKKKCHVHMVLKKRPMGYMVAWLLSGRQHCCRDDHFAVRLERLDAGPCGYAARCRARSLAKTQPDLQVFFDLEARFPPQQGAGEEPSAL